MNEGKLLDSIKQASRDTAQPIHSDAQLAEALGVGAPVISHIRAGNRKIGDAMIIRINELMGWTIRDIKSVLGEPCLPSLVPP